MIRMWLAAIMLALLGSAPAAAQFSPAYNFIKAVKDKDVAAAKKILDEPGTTVVNARDGDSGDMALHLVTRRADLGWVVFLLQQGANLNARDRDGNTPLMLATQGRFGEGVRVFIQVKAQLDAPNRLGETPLLKAVQNRDAVSAKLLIDAGASADITDNTGATARSIANADTRSAQIARLLKDVPVRGAAKAQGPSL